MNGIIQQIDHDLLELIPVEIQHGEVLLLPKGEGDVRIIIPVQCQALLTMVKSTARFAGASKMENRQPGVSYGPLAR
jgi:hypothetical protein